MLSDNSHVLKRRQLHREVHCAVHLREFMNDFVYRRDLAQFEQSLGGYLGAFRARFGLGELAWRLRIWHSVNSVASRNSLKCV